MSSDGLEEMFEGDFADMCTEKFPLVSIGADQRVKHAQTPIGASKNIVMK